MKRIGLVLSFFISIIYLAGCSSNVENPEDALKEYTDSWVNGQYVDMLSALSSDSIALIEQQEWTFEERYTKVYQDLAVTNIRVGFEPVDFKKEGIKLKDLTAIDYPVNVAMDTVAGEIVHTIDLELILETDTNDKEKWKVVWHPSHLLAGLQEVSDRISLSTTEPKRGQILDRNGQGLAINGKVLEVYVVPEGIDNFDEAVARLSQILGLEEERVARLAKQYPNHPDWAAPIQRIPVNDSRRQSLIDIKGVGLNTVDGRVYPYGNITGHLLGHIGLITAEEIAGSNGKGYSGSSMIGKNNLELVYENTLRGVPGATITVTDESRSNSRVVAKKEQVDGEDIYLTIDIKVQQDMVSSLNGQTGSAVVMNPTTGEVLALVSEPAFDSNLRYLGFQDPRAVGVDNVNFLFEKRFQNIYSPGSIFKPITAVIGIEEGKLTPEEKLTIEGRRWQANAGWGGYHVVRVNEAESQVDLNVAMMRSDNIYFAQQSLNLGATTMEKWASRLGFGDVLPFEFPMYASTLSNTGINTEILLADTGYGQGQILVSPLHMTAMYSIFLNDGSMIQPTLLLNQQSAYFEENIATSSTIDTVVDSMVEVVENRNGTAYRVNPGHQRKVAGKTGTAELKKNSADQEGEQIGWYVSFDYEQKDLLVTVMLQNVQNRGGSSLAVDAANRFWGKVAR